MLYLQTVPCQPLPPIRSARTNARQGIRTKSSHDACADSPRISAFARTTRRLRLSFLAALLLLATLGAPRTLDSHEVPERVAIRLWALPSDSTLTLLVRVPLEAMRDLDFPERADGSLDLVAVRALLIDAAQLWIASGLAPHADGEPLDQPRIIAARIATPDDRAFDGAASALAKFAAPLLGDETSLPWQSALFDVQLEYRLPRPDAALSVTPALAHLGVRTTSVLHLVLEDGTERAYAYPGDPGRIELDPRWWQSAARFVVEGFHHILEGLDHLLFVFCLVLPVRRWRPLVAIVTSFTVAHSITLGAAALGVVPTALWFPPLVEMAIALSIVWLAVENFLLPEDRLAGRWKIAFGFGLIHGFGFSFALGEQLQFAGANLITALAAFNIGVELGQLAALAVAIPVLHFIRQRLPAERAHLVTWVGSAFVAHSAWHWMTERWETFRAFDLALAWPVFDATFGLYAVRVGLVVAIAAALAFALQQILPRFLRS